MTHALNHPVRLEVISTLHQGAFSAGEVAEVIGGDVRYRAGHIRILYDAGCIEFVDFKWIGSRARPVFRSVVLPVITDEVFRSMPKDERHDANGAIVQGFLAESLHSYRNEKMDSADEPPCLIW